MFFIDHIDDGSPCNASKCLLEVDGYFIARGASIGELMANSGAGSFGAVRLVE